jgi:type I restriction enzyme S subunit
MNADRLLAHYERIADEPDAISRLRHFVLDLAVRGKLMPQNSKDEPSSELLKRIAAEKTRLLKTGEFREPSSFVQIERKDLPFVAPGHWAWVRLIEIAKASYGFAFPSGQFNLAKRGTPLIRIRDISATDTEAYFEGDYDPAYVVRAGDYLVGMDGDFNLRRWCGADGLLNQRVMRLNGWRCGVDPEFVRLPLQFLLDHLHRGTSLTTVKHLSAKQVNGIEIPLPPLAEQHRIVAKVDELMTLCDRLEAARAEREATRDRLAAASLARLSAPDPETFRADAGFVLDSLRALTTRPDQIKRLRESILNLAVHGLLVPQDPKDEPACTLLERLDGRGSGTRLTRKRGILQTSSSGIPFACPSGWEWTTVQGLLDEKREISYGVIKLGDEPKTGGVPTLRCSDVKPGFVNLSAVRKVSEGIEAEYARTRLHGGEILINIRGTLGGVAHVPTSLRGFNVAREIAVIPIKAAISAPFIVYLMLSSYFWDSIQENLRGIAYKGLNLGTLREFPVPLPPLAEQHRIVAKVDELTALCDRLEANLTACAETRRRLLDALLAEALAPNNERELEAAE